MVKKIQQSTDQTNPEQPANDELKTTLINLEKSGQTPSLPNELNRKITTIDAELDGLKQELNLTNNGVRDSLEQLSESDKSLTVKVSETYQKLGELDKTYRMLSERSSHISKEIKTIGSKIQQISSKSETDIDLLNQGYEALLQRTDELVRKSKETTSILNKSIKENARTIRELQQQLISEIDTLSETSRQRDEDLNEANRKLEESLDQAQEQIRSTQAQQLKMQAVDEALERRAGTLEESTEELTRMSRQLSRSTSLLNRQTEHLALQIENLKTRIDIHDSRIDDLEQRSKENRKSLAALAGLEKRHFLALGSLIGLLILAIVALNYLQNSYWQDEAQANSRLESDIQATQQSLEYTDRRVDRLDRQQAVRDQAVEEKLHSIDRQLVGIDQQLVSMGDQVDSLDGRLSSQRPARQFGVDNTIHGPEWLAGLPRNHHVIYLGLMQDKASLYQIAERYSHYLQEQLSYMPLQVGQHTRYALFLGDFDTREAASRQLNQLPPRIEGKAPSVLALDEVQPYIR